MGEIIRPGFVMRHYGTIADRTKATYLDINELELQFTPAGFPTFPRRRFAMACRPLCGQDLHWPHPTCWASCRFRRVYYGKMPARMAIHMLQLQMGRFQYLLRVLDRRRFARIKDVLIRLCLTVAKVAYGPSPMYYTGYRGRNLVVWGCLTTSEILAN